MRKIFFLIGLLMVFSAIGFSSNSSYDDSTTELMSSKSKEPRLFGAGNLLLRVNSDHSYGWRGMDDEFLLWPGLTGDEYLFHGTIWFGCIDDSTEKVVCSYFGIYEWIPDGSYSTLPLYSDEDNWDERPGWVHQLSDLDYFTDCYDQNDPDPIGVSCTAHGLSWQNSPDDDYIIISYRLFNESGHILEDIYFGTKWDFDIGGGLSFDNDMTAYDETNEVAYMYDYDGDYPGYAGVAVLSDTPSGFHYWDINNDPETDSQKYIYLSDNNFMSDSEVPFDWRILLSAGPYTLDDDEDMRFDIVLVMGDGFDDMLDNLDSARSIYDGLPLDIQLTTFEARYDKGSMMLRWSVETTEGENISGFNLYRREVGLTDTIAPVPGGEDTHPRWTRINSSLITGSNPYSYIDDTVESGTTYEYELEAVVEEKPETLGTTTGRCGLPTSFEIVSLHPNPTTDEVNITLSTPETTEVRIKVYDITGRLVISEGVGEVDSGEYTEVLSTSELSSGVYTVKAETTEGVSSTKRMVVVR